MDNGEQGCSCTSGQSLIENGTWWKGNTCIMKSIETLRAEIDAADQKLVPLLKERMGLSCEVAAWKKENNIAVHDAAREQQVLEKVRTMGGETFQPELRELYAKIMQVSRQLQKKLLDPKRTAQFINECKTRISPPAEYTAPVVAHQGVAGAYAEEAARRLFPSMQALECPSFEAVLKAIGGGQAAYGVLPIENSSTGAIAEVYDLLRKYGTFIVAEYKLKISHRLLALPGARLAKIARVYSHPEGLNQCRDYLQALGAECIPCANTALAVKMVAESGDKTAAAIGSMRAGDAYSLTVLEERVSFREDNYTRFVAVSARMEVTPRADKISLFFTLPHTPGSLATVLTQLAAAGLNMEKIESRPIHNKNWEYYFYVDLVGNLLAPGLLEALAEVYNQADYFELLGNYPGHREGSDSK